jgi:hypothetical protein
MKISIGKIILTAVMVEVLTILALVLVVGVFGPSDPGAAEAYAERLGTFLGPTAGFLLTLAGGWWIAKRAEDSRVLNGLLVGAAVAAIDILILVLSGAGFQLLFVVSNVGRVIAGAIGGLIARRQPSAQSTL